VIGSSAISNAHLNHGHVTIKANQTLTLDNDTITGTHFADTASGAVIQIDGGTTLKLDHATIDGGTINDFSTPPSGSMIAGDIDVIGSSTISNAQLNYGNVTIGSGLTLTLDGDTVTGTAFTGVATGSIIHVDGSDTLTLNSATVSGGGVTIGADAQVKTSGDVTLTNTSVTNDGTIEITGGTLKITGSVASSGPDASGSIKIDSGAVLDLDGSDTQNIVFAGANAELKIDASSFGGSISGLAATDQIDLRTIGYGPGTTGTYSGGVLTITDGTHSISMTLTGDYSDAHFAGSSDGHGGTLITLNAHDDAPAFDAADATQIANVTELADTTGSTTASDSSSPASGTLHFTDIDLTDRPTATVTQSVTWASGTTDLSSSLTPTEISALEHAFSLTQSGNTNNGVIGWSYQISDSALDFLGAGETAQVTSTVLLHDHQHGHDTATVTVTIAGANDAPVLAADTSGPAGPNQHAIAELAGQTGDTVDHDSASGTLSFTDADLDDTHTLSHSGPTYVLSGGTLDAAQIDALTAAGQLTLSEIDSTHSGVGSVSFSYSAPDSSFDFLAEGQTLTVSYTITVTDNSNVSSSQPVTFTITGSNDAPVVDAHNATMSYTENHAPAAIDAALTLSDVDSATLGSATVQISGNFVAGEDVLGFTDKNGIHGSYDAVHGILTLTGTSSVANYEAALASVTYFDSSDNPSDARRTIGFSVDDGATANSHSNIATATVDVTPVNDPPVVTFAAPAHGAISVPENTATHLSGISVSDVDAGASDITVTLALPDGSSGSLSAGNFDGVTIGGSAIALTITGSLAEINTFLADTEHGVTYTPATGLIHDVTLTATANDHGATGSGGALDSTPKPVPLDLVPDGLPASHANLIVNGGFETGDFSGWKLGNGTGHAIGINFLVGSEHSEHHGSGDMAHHGLREALFGGTGGDVTLSQSVATNANEHYTVDFWVMNDTAASPGKHGLGGNDFSASWNGVALMPTIVNADKSSGYTEYQFDVTGAADHSTLEFSARNNDGYWNLDDVSVREGAPDTVNQLTDETTSVSGVHAGDALTVTPADSNSLGMVTAAAGTGTVEWQFAASNALLDHLIGLTQTYTVSDASHPAVAQTVAVSIGGLGHDQFVFHPGVGADTMVNFSTVSNSQGNYVGDTIELDKFSNIHSISDVLQKLSTDAHGNAVVDLGNHDSITFQGINAATIQANAMHMFVLHSTSGNIA
jgi:VCBS repeat-containing protein